MVATRALEERVVLGLVPNVEDELHMVWGYEMQSQLLYREASAIWIRATG